MTYGKHVHCFPQFQALEKEFLRQNENKSAPEQIENLKKELLKMGCKNREMADERDLLWKELHQRSVYPLDFWTTLDVAVIDDASICRELMKKKFETKKPKSVQVFSDLGDFLNSLSSPNKGLPNVLMIDINLENNISGLDVVRSLRMCYQGMKNVLVCGISGDNLGDSKELDHFMKKPLNSEKLEQLMRKYVTRQVTSQPHIYH